MENEEEKRTFITNHFSHLFRSSSSQDIHRLLNCVKEKVTPEMNDSLLRDFSREEICDALNSIGNLKAPGPDGNSAIFYKEFWEIVGDDVTNAVLDVCSASRPIDANGKFR